MCSPDAPEAPDPLETAAAQTGTNVSTAIANNMLSMIDQAGPNGTLSYNQTGTYDWTDPSTGETYTLPRFEAVTSLTPDGQRILDRSQDAKYAMADTAANSAEFLRSYLGDTSNMPKAPQYDRVGTDFSADRRRVEEAILERMSPQMDRDEEALRTRLTQQGITIGSDAYNAEMDRAGRARNDARIGAILSGGQEQSRLANMDLANVGFNNAASARSFADGMTRRNQPINEITALLSGSQVSQPNYGITQPSGIATTDVAGLINDGYRNDYNMYSQQMQQRNNLLGGLFGAGATLLGAPPGALGGWFQ